MDRLYIALARDPETKDDIVFGVRAEIPVQARQLIEKFYREQCWGDSPARIQVESFRNNAKDPVLFLGHAHHEYVKLEEQIKQLCSKLLEVADWYEGDTGSISTRDEIYAFVAGFESGKQLIEAKYAPSQEEASNG